MANETGVSQAEEMRRLRELHRWHMQRFVGLGFNRGQSERLELEGVDWHDAERLLMRKGSRTDCSHKTAMLILL